MSLKVLAPAGATLKKNLWFINLRKKQIGEGGGLGSFFKAKYGIALLAVADSFHDMSN